ncbi:glycoside hydrolase family 92 protein [Pedobacter sp. MC2016-14]|uniref:glycoside hydrolase domain-containing protein n=1 Tax=Pedobacter sp. MC2016-14 TaxID=2897327 RepID=UPI001E3C7AC7|nr:glycoside hydrolase domain-containing protein [Pedobacter sp. MC2016-14]MCD0488197.1 glycoside hydrolase family 92 protein [Pedobacter sp. MC2016-14]
MINKFSLIALISLSTTLSVGSVKSQSHLVNVFLGSSGDHGQMSPAATSPFSMMSIGPQTYPKLHAGYEHKAKLFLGFTHNRFEGVGCQGSGGNLLIKPYLGTDPQKSKLIKTSESAAPGNYQVAFSNKIKATFAVMDKQGLEHYEFPAGAKGFYLDLSHTLYNRFVSEEHQIEGQMITGSVSAKTTCNEGTYKIYYAVMINKPVKWTDSGNHKLTAVLEAKETDADIRVAFSSVDVLHAKANLGKEGFAVLQSASTKAWDDVLGRIKVNGDVEKSKLFYSLLYRTMQSPYVISEQDGSFRSTDGNLRKSKETMYNGWAIWDNYRTQLPLLAITLPDKYQGMTASMANLYAYGKKDFATQNEPTNTVRTEHAIVVLLDAYRKGFKVDFAAISDSLMADIDRLDYTHPDKALESSYDAWAYSQILKILKKDELSAKYLKKAAEYKAYWKKDFEDQTKKDVDKVAARGLYQGTILQYRWFAPFDLKGLQELMGGEKAYIKQLDYFFENDQYNHANEPDTQAPFMYNATVEPWKSQFMVHKLAGDTVVQYYFNDNSRGIDPFIDRIYKNQPDAYIRTMDDDAGAMSGWYVFAACGFSPACVGWPAYYLNVPLFPEVSLALPGGKSFKVVTDHFNNKHPYIAKVSLNGKVLDRLWITHEEIIKGGELIITASDKPVTTLGIENLWISDMNK